jgi:hypothetical protein
VFINTAVSFSKREWNVPSPSLSQGKTRNKYFL